MKRTYLFTLIALFGLITACTPPPQNVPPASVAITSHQAGDIITGSREITITAALTNTDPTALITANHNGDSVAATRTGNTATVAITLDDNYNSITITAANPHQETPSTATVNVTFPFVSLSNGQAAAVVIGQPDFETTSEAADNKAIGSVGGRPAIVGGRLYLPDLGWATEQSGGVTAYQGRVMGYHEVPTENDATADFVIGQQGFSSTVTTPSDWAIARPHAVLAYNETLFVVDRDWNRILFFGGLPTATGTSAKYVVGQPDFSSNDHDCAAKSLNTPEGVTVAGTKLIVADRMNNRVLIWNGIPTRSGAPADMVLGQMSTVGCTGNDDNQGGTQDPQPSNRTLLLPRDVWSDGERLAVLDTSNNRVLIWTTFPTSSFTPADIVLGQSTFTTADSGSGASSFDGPRTLHSNGNQLFVTDTRNNRVLVWNEFPTQNGQPADVVLGQSNMTDNDENGGGSVSASGFEYPTSVYVHDNMLFVGDRDNDRYLVFNGGNP